MNGSHMIALNSTRRLREFDELTLRGSVKTLFTGLLGVFTLLSAVEPLQAESVLGIGLGYKTASMQWSYAGNQNGCCPETFSETSWKDLGIVFLSGTLDAKAGHNIRLLGRADYGVIVSGDQFDSDNNQQGGEISRTENDGSSGTAYDLSFGVGYQLLEVTDNRVGKQLRLTPKIGYAYSGQRLTMQDGQQTRPVAMPINGMDDTFKTQWWGPWFGLLAELEISPDSSFHIDGQYHFADYYGDGVRKMRNDFEHHAAGVGYVFRLNYRKRQLKNWEWVIGLEFESWAVRDGTYTDYLSDGTSIERNLNDVGFKSRGVMLQTRFYY